MQRGFICRACGRFHIDSCARCQRQKCQNCKRQASELRHCKPPWLLRLNPKRNGGTSYNQISFLAPIATTLKVPSGAGLCNASASSIFPRIHVSLSASLSRQTGMAFSWTAPTSAFGSVVRNAKTIWSSLTQFAPGATNAVSTPPDSCEEEQRAGLVYSKPCGDCLAAAVVVFAEASHRD